MFLYACIITFSGDERVEELQEVNDNVNVNFDGLNGNLNLIELTQQPEWKQILTNIVQKEKMDPWNIDICLLTDKFTEEISEIKKIDFRIPANAILASSILLRFKSDAWILSKNLDLAEVIYIPDSVISEPIFPTLEPMLRMTKRNVTFDELINAIEDIMIKEKQSGQKRKIVVNAIPQHIVDLMRQDGEGFEKKVDEVMQKILNTVDKDKLTVFSNLITKKEKDEVIQHFVPVLHLANNDKIDIWQDEHFGEIFIQVNHHTNGNGKKEQNGNSNGNGKKEHNGKAKNENKATETKKETDEIKLIEKIKENN